MNYILTYKNGGASEIYFPPKNTVSGTCDFATKYCLDECKLTTNANIERVLYYIENYPVEVIVRKIINELVDERNKILYWFASGDCPERLTDKIIKIIKRLNGLGVIQVGFTRNRRLWNAFLTFSGIRIALTIEDNEEARSFSKRGLVSSPDYETWRTRIYYNRHLTGLCGGGWFVLEETAANERHLSNAEPNDCSICHEKNSGCFKKIA